MLYLIGLGLGDAKDITVKGLEIVKKVSKVYLENYTSILGCDHDELEKLYGRSVILADREMVEQGCDEILNAAQDENGVALLVVGDPMNATTHTDLLLRAASRNISYQIIHNASIVNAIACCGLQIYNFGETISIPFWTDTWKPDSFYDKILRNKKNGLHTLCLLDIKVKEPNLELLVQGIEKSEPPRFMTVSQAAEQLVNIIQRRRVNFGGGVSSDDSSILINPYEDGKIDIQMSEDDICIGVARIGSDSQKIIRTTLIDATQLDLGGPLHSLVIPGQMHPLEEEIVNLFVERSQPSL